MALEEDAVNPPDEHRMWHFENTAADLDVSDQPWPFHERTRHPKLATEVAEFAEMLCQIDPRMDKALPSCWMRHAYLFALMDALRTDYASAYARQMVHSGNDRYGRVPDPSYMQFKFWQDERDALSMVDRFVHEQSIGQEGADDHEPAELSEHTERRRRDERELGLEPTEVYPFWVNDQAPEGDDPEGQDMDSPASGPVTGVDPETGVIEGEGPFDGDAPRSPWRRSPGPSEAS